MEKIKIITDSTLDLPADLVREKGIEVLPLLINFGEESYLDGVEINTHDMLERIVEGKYSSYNSSSYTKQIWRNI